MDGWFVEYSTICALLFCHDGFFSFHGQEMRAAILSRVAPNFSARAAALVYHDNGNSRYKSL